MKNGLAIVAFAAAISSAALGAREAHAAGFTVNSTVDAPDANPGDGVCETASGNGVCTLRAAVHESNFLPGAHTVTVPAGTYTAVIPGSEEVAAQGDYDVTGSLTIVGAGARSTVIDGGGINRVFDVRTGASLSMSGVTVRNGVQVTALDGGGIIVRPDGRLTLDRSTIAGNGSGRNGGGISNLGNAEITNSTIRDNRATGFGGGITNTGRLTLVNTTIGDNQAGQGGGLYGGGTSHVAHATITGNIATSGGNIFADAGRVTLVRNTIVSNALRGDNCAGPVASAGSSLSSDESCNFTASGDLRNTDPKLASLADNGGPTDTQALLAGSPAIDAVRGTPCPPPARDQRGSARAADGNGDGNAHCDMGAFELQPSSDLAVTIADARASASVGSAVTYTVTVSNRGPQASSGVTVTGTVSPGVTLRAASIDGGTCSVSGRTATCRLQTLGSDGSAAIRITATLTAPGVIFTKATVRGRASDPVSANNTATQRTTVRAATAAR